MQRISSRIARQALREQRRTKIIATIGPATHSYQATADLVAAGTNGFRLNFSHGSHEERIQQIAWIRKASKISGKPVAIIQDLQGPKIRLGDFDGIVNITKGQGLSFAYQADYSVSGHLPTQYDLSDKVKRGERIYLYDGKIRTAVTSVRSGVVYVTAENDGILIKRKGMNLPDTDFAGDIITPKDRADMIFGTSQDIDYVALSFIQTAADIERVRRLLRGMNSTAKIIAKIETKTAVDNLEAITRESDVVMVARGDLAVETPAESVPVVQRQVIVIGRRFATPTIVATHLLASMTDDPEPTRAEVSDIAMAVMVGADAVMLSDETAQGRYPTQAVETMERVINYTERHTPLDVTFPPNDDHSRQIAISNAILSLAESIAATAIVAETKSGATVFQLSSLRSTIPIIAVTSDDRTAQQLAIVCGVGSYARPVDKLAASKLTDWLRRSKLLKKRDIVVTTSGRYPGVVGTTDTIKVRVLE